MGNAERGALPSALDRWEQLRQACQGRKIAVFLDYDGTLTPIVERPEDAVLSKEMREAVRRLAERHTVAVVSGRDKDDVRQLVGLDEIVYAGSHGFDISGPGGLSMQHESQSDFLPILERAEAELRDELASIRGSQVERKRFTIAIHYRRVADPEVPRVEAVVDAVGSSHPELRKAHGKKVFELQPDVEWHKGMAVLWLLRRLGLESPDVLPIYLGDDTTDEDAFATLNDRDPGESRGIGIVVLDKPRESRAQYSLHSPDEVRVVLERLAGLD